MLNVKKCIAFVLCALMFVLSSNMMVSQARYIDDFEDFVVYYETTTVGEKYTRYLLKTRDLEYAVLNLTPTTANGKYITAIMRNDEGAARGSVNMKVGTRSQFATTGQAGYRYRLGIRKTYNSDGLAATLYGSWSPDYK